MSELGDLIAERSARHAREAKAKRGADLSYTQEDGVHYVTWHTQQGYEFLSSMPDSNLALWHSIFVEDDAEHRVSELLDAARSGGLSIYNDRPAWRRAMPAPWMPALVGIAALAFLLVAFGAGTARSSHVRRAANPPPRGRESSDSSALSPDQTFH